MTTVKVLRSGDSLGVTLPPDVVERLGLHEGDELSVVAADGKVQLSKHGALSRRECDVLEYVFTHHGKTLELLAKR